MSIRKILTKMFSFFKNMKKPVKTNLKQEYLDLKLNRGLDLKLNHGLDLENTMERICGCCGHKTKLI